MNYELLMLNDAVVMVERGWTQQILARGTAGATSLSPKAEGG